MNVTLIEKLKKNETLFGRLSDEEQQVFKDVGKLNCVHWTYWGNGSWKVSSIDINEFFRDSLYRVKLGYKVPQPNSVRVRPKTIGELVNKRLFNFDTTYDAILHEKREGDRYRSFNIPSIGVYCLEHNCSHLGGGSWEIIE